MRSKSVGELAAYSEQLIRVGHYARLSYTYAHKHEKK